MQTLHEITLKDIRKIEKFKNLSEQEALKMVSDIKSFCKIAANIVVKNNNRIEHE